MISFVQLDKPHIDMVSFTKIPSRFLLTFYMEIEYRDDYLSE